jgi:hypothetical protein
MRYAFSHPRVASQQFSNFRTPSLFFVRLPDGYSIDSPNHGATRSQVPAKHHAQEVVDHRDIRDAKGFRPPQPHQNRCLIFTPGASCFRTKNPTAAIRIEYFLILILYLSIA